MIDINKIVTDAGYIVNLNKNTIGFEIKHAYLGTILPGNSRGGHFHKKHIELFVCIKGEINVLTETTHILCSEMIKESEMILVEANKLHTLRNMTHETVHFIGFTNKIHDPNNKDTYERGELK